MDRMMKSGSKVKTGINAHRAEQRMGIGGIAGWFIERLRSKPRDSQRLMLLDRITLAPRQSLALVEAEGRRILVATSAEGGPSFYPLDERAGEMTTGAEARKAGRQARASW